MSKAPLATAATVASLLPAQPAFAQSQRKLGKVASNYPATATAKSNSNQATLYQHSFWSSSLQFVLEDVLKAAPGCSVAHWGPCVPCLLRHTRNSYRLSVSERKTGALSPK